MSILNELVAVAVITVLAVISPGGDFAMVTRNSLLMGRRAGIITAWGIALGTWVHIAYTIIGVAVVIKMAPWILDLIKIFGAFYLIYIGIQTARMKPIDVNSTEMRISDFQALKMGILTNALNPKTTLFVVSLYSQIVSEYTPLITQLGYGAFISLAHGLWFTIVALIFSNPLLVKKALTNQVIVNRIIGVVLTSLGISLSLTAL